MPPCVALDAASPRRRGTGMCAVCCCSSCRLAWLTCCGAMVVRYGAANLLSSPLLPPGEANGGGTQRARRRSAASVEHSQATRAGMRSAVHVESIQCSPSHLVCHYHHQQGASSHSYPTHTTSMSPMLQTLPPVQQPQPWVGHTVANGRDTLLHVLGGGLCRNGGTEPRRSPSLNTREAAAGWHWRKQRGVHTWWQRCVQGT